MLLASRRLLFSLVVLVAVAPASVARGAANVATFEDARGEDPSGPDITRVVVSDRADGLITFRINIPSHPTLGDDMRIRVWVDSDSNRATGLTADELVGFDYFLRRDRDGAKLFRCGASSCSNDVPQRTLGFSYRGGATFAISAFELATKSFRFRVDTTAGIGFDPATRTYDFTKAKLDFAPGQSQFWTYNVGLGPSRLLAKRLSVTPARPTGGRPLRVALTATRSDTGAPVTSGRVACSATIGGKPAKLRSRGFARGRATCTFLIPENAEGWTIRGSITIASGRQRVTKAFFRRIG
jgi:hypothetical protein